MDKKLRLLMSLWFARDAVVKPRPAAGDCIGLATEPGIAGAQPLLTRVMVNGCRKQPPRPMGDLRARRRAAVAQRLASVRRLHHPTKFPVRFSEKLLATINRVSRLAAEERVGSGD